MANSPELKITSVQTSEYRSGIPLLGWESVEEALNTFASGKTREGRATQEDLIENMPDGAMGVGLYLLATEDIDRNAFVESMLKHAKPAVTEGRGRWIRLFDYDAMGTSFFKTTVEITRLPNTQDGYLLGLSAAFDVEDGLAETLGVEQRLHWISVNVGLEPVGTKFRVDFDAIADRLQPLYAELESDPTPEPRSFRQGLVEAARGEQPTEKPALTGEAIVRTLLPTDEYTTGSNLFVLGFKAGVGVLLDLERLGARFNWRNGIKSEELWEAEGAVLSGPLAASYSGDRHLELPSIVVSIKPSRYDRLSAIDPEMKATMNGLAERVAAAFQPAAQQ